jgi:tetrahydromethanopterin S-methyltransferase subunit C
MWGILAGFFGLLTNAVMIDIFEASKVAFIFWMVMGMTVGYLKVPPVEAKLAPKMKLKKKIKK